MIDSIDSDSIEKIMCGISGYISEKQYNDEALKKVLVHRGPDNLGTIKKVVGETKIFMAHNRLSILDPSSWGHQPMHSSDRKISVIFNGEIYNHHILKKRYLDGYSFRSGTDTEVLLYLYEEFGIRFVDKLNGDFAIAILDMRISSFFLIRDRSGIKPVYFYNDVRVGDDSKTISNTFVFGSEIKSIIAAGIKPELEENNVQQYFIFKYVPQNRTLFKNIERLAPGAYLEYDLREKSLRKIRYWSLEKNTDYSKASYQDAKAELYSLIEDSVNMQLMADVPLGVFLSGGLDSSIIASFIKENKDIRYYCASKEKGDLKKEGTSSDFYYASRLANDWNLHINELPIGSDQANPDLIKSVLSFNDDLIADGSQIPTYLITREAQKGSKVILSGMGGDELFLGYPGHLLALLSLKLDMLPSAVSIPLMRLFRKIDQGKGRFLSYRRYLHKIGKYYTYPLYKYGIMSIVGDFENSASVYRGDRDSALRVFKGYFQDDHDIFESLFHFEYENFLVKNLHYIDGMSMANSIESRVPLLDYRIVEFAYGIQRRYKLSEFGKSKKILKDTFGSVLPSYIIRRKKAGFGMPLRSIFSSEQTIEKLLDLDFFRNFDRFSIKDIKRISNNHVQGREDNSSIIYALISFQEWYKLRFS